MDICWNGDDMRLRCSLSYPDISCVCQLQKQKNGIQVFLSGKRHSALPFIRSDGSYRHICIAMVCGSRPICIFKGRNYRIIYCDCEDDSELFTAVHVRRAGNSGCDDHLVYFGYAYRHAGDLSIITKV